MGREVTQIDAPADASLVWDNTEVLSVVGSSAQIQLDTGGGLTAASVQRARVQISNGLTPDGLIIGSMYQPDFTMTDLVLGVTLDVVIQDADLYRKIYYGGGTAGAMVDDVLAGQIDLKAASAGYATGTTPFSMEIKSTGSNFEFMVLPIALRGQDMVVAQLGAQIKLKPESGNTYSSYQIVLINTVPAY
jgi:hypothetical protein